MLRWMSFSGDSWLSRGLRDRGLRQRRRVVSVAWQAGRVAGSPFQQAVQILWLALAHKLRSYLVTFKAVLSLQGFVHDHHLRVFTVTDFAFISLYLCCQCKDGRYDHDGTGFHPHFCALQPD